MFLERKIISRIEGKAAFFFGASQVLAYTFTYSSPVAYYVIDRIEGKAAFPFGASQVLAYQITYPHVIYHVIHPFGFILFVGASTAVYTR